MDDKLEKWSKMEFNEKQKYNGYKGFCNGVLFKDDNAFMRADNVKLKKRLEKEKILRNRHKIKKQEALKNGKTN